MALNKAMRPFRHDDDDDDLHITFTFTFHVWETNVCLLQQIIPKYFRLQMNN